MTAALAVLDLVHVDAWLAHQWPAIPVGRRARIAVRLLHDRRGEVLTPCEVAELLTPSPYLPPDDDDSRAAADAYDRHLHRGDAP